MQQLASIMSTCHCGVSSNKNDRGLRKTLDKQKDFWPMNTHCGLRWHGSPSVTLVWHITIKWRAWWQWHLSMTWVVLTSIVLGGGWGNPSLLNRWLSTPSACMLTEYPMGVIYNDSNTDLIHKSGAYPLDSKWSNYKKSSSLIDFPPPFSSHIKSGGS